MFFMKQILFSGAFNPMTDLERKVQKRVHEFDLISLLRLLMSMGYGPQEVRFMSHNSICSQAGLIHGIRFSPEPVKEVVITLNLGLLSAQSPLPTYFRKKMDSEISESRAFVDFIGFFDHHLIRDYICNIYPEINRFFFPSWELTKRRYLHILDLKSCSSLHWLFQAVFPEIGVQMVKALLSRDLQTIPVSLGKSALGSDAVFGRKARVPIHGRRITLYSEDENTATQVPWPREIKNRLESLVFPLLRPVGINLEIYLVLKSQKRWARLHRETYLGYDRIRDSGESYRRIRIFRGYIGEEETTVKEVVTQQPEIKKLAAG